MKIVNANRNTTVAERAKLASNMLRRLVGLMGKKSLGDGEALILRPCNSVHTCFMNFPIDVIFLDGEGRVVKLYPRLEPFRFTSMIWKSSFAVELPAGTIERSGTTLDDRLLIQH